MQFLRATLLILVLASCMPQDYLTEYDDSGKAEVLAGESKLKYLSPTYVLEMEKARGAELSETEEQEKLTELGSTSHFVYSFLDAAEHPDQVIMLFNNQKQPSSFTQPESTGMKENRVHLFFEGRLPQEGFTIVIATNSGDEKRFTFSQEMIEELP